MSKEKRKMVRNITLPAEVLEKMANILFQDMTNNNPHSIVTQARMCLLDMDITLTEKDQPKI